MKPLKLLTGTALVGFTALAANAAEPMQGRHGMMRDPFPISIAEAETRAGERFATLDKDGDGKVTRDEFAAGHMAGRRDLMMGGHGGMRAHGPGPEGMHGPGMQMPGMGGPMAGPAGSDPDTEDDADARATMRESFHARLSELDPEIFKRLDANEDGKLDAAEFGMEKVHATAHAVMRDSMFERLDKNADGVLTRDEMPDAVSRLREMDKNGDGTVTRDEAHAWRQAHGGTTR